MMYWIFMTAQTWAASGGHDAAHDGAHAIPWTSLFVQAFNFGFLLLLLAYLLRKNIAAHFAHRSAEYNQLVQKAEAAKAEAEKNRRTIQDRLTQLEKEGANTSAQAEAEAKALTARLQGEAKVLAAKIEQEAARSAAVEADKARLALRVELLEKSLEAAKDKMQKLGSTEQKNLQKEFVDKIQVVGG